MPPPACNWFWCRRNRVWNRKACKHAVCAKNPVIVRSSGAPTERPAFDGRP